jgi:uncharacterized coiled-coil DUF342 family protein
MNLADETKQIVAPLKERVAAAAAAEQPALALIEQITRRIADAQSRHDAARAAVDATRDEIAMLNAQLVAARADAAPLTAAREEAQRKLDDVRAQILAILP